MKCICFTTHNLNKTSSVKHDNILTQKRDRHNLFVYIHTNWNGCCILLNEHLLLMLWENLTLRMTYAIWFTGKVQTLCYTDQNTGVHTIYTCNAYQKVHILFRRCKLIYSNTSFMVYLKPLRRMR